MTDFFTFEYKIKTAATFLFKKKKVLTRSQEILNEIVYRLLFI